LCAVVDDVNSLIKRVVGPAVEVTLERCGEPCIVHADPGHLRQIIMNLAVNAGDAMEGKGKIRIDLELAPPPPEWEAQKDAASGLFPRMRIRDTGTGIAPNVLPRIFEPYFTTKPPGKGTGLGLAGVYGMVEQHGGHIRVATEVGEGTTFDVFFPATDARLPAKKPPADAPQKEAEFGGTDTILVVEDVPVVLRVAQLVLASGGYNVLTARDGAEALALLDQDLGKVDLILSDVAMPEMDGKGLLREVRARHPEILLVMMTAYTDPFELKALKKIHDGPLLHKPFAAPVLLQTVRTTLDKAAPPAKK
jgi:CheY-like chemotaxis protein